MPSEIYINGKRQNEVKPNYDFDKGEHEVKLIWNFVITSAKCMFIKCKNIIEMDFSNFDTSQITSMENMFLECTSIQSLNLANFDLSQVESIEKMFQGCSNLEYINLEKAKVNTNKYESIFNGISSKIIVCSNDEKWMELLNGNIINIKCNNNENNNIEYKCYQSNIEYQHNKYICDKCGSNYFKMNKALNNANSYINCYNYLIEEESDSIIKKTENYIKDKSSSIVIFQTQKICIDDNSNNNHVNQFINNMTLEKDISKNIIEGIISGVLNEEMKIMTQKNSSYNITIKSENDIHYISSLSQMIEKIEISSINFGDCENILKQNYLFESIDDIVMYKIEHYIEGFKIPILEYSLFLYKDDEIIQLNLERCNNISVIYYIPIIIDEKEINQYNPESDLYKDKCSSHKSESGADISLYDRKINFNVNHMSLCENNCKFLRYESENSRVACECKIKSDFSYYTNNTNIDDLLITLESEKSKSNLAIISCNVLSSQENIKSNTGFYLLLFIFVIFVIIFIIFCTRGYGLLKNKIDDVIYKKFKNKKDNKNVKFEQLNHSNINQKNKKYNRNVLSDNKTVNSVKTLPNKNKNKSKKKASKFKPDKSNNISNVISNIISNKNKPNKQSYMKSFKPDTDYELNWLSYEDAIRYDKRASCEYYGSLIKNKQLLIFTFCSFNDYNSGIIKKFILFLSFALHYAINTLFFTDSNMHQIYEDEGKFNFIYQLPKILYSALISSFIMRIMLQTFVLTDKDILQVKSQETKSLAISMKKKILKCILIKYSFFFILNFILLGLFWYYVTVFNAIYKNTQIYLILNTFISFGFSLFYPYTINIIPMMIRKCSINSTKKDKRYFYRVSQIIQLL